ncbi:hypothetical protein BJF92_00160 [Rhizobium rhizosphaerae]|uniref:O-GlcNAc transferase C-terminal domain-containing protein n=1 Tax=Xaviernesmea rhizosphaerae TaxID=1672749 RepID=A0A1Q9AEA8_9HYPH|nr:hypothetical protein [Xaviernesmea rhizosphaerae]OLP53226.1 hypothetical protein BJF92_00160 [Xaviernesmea rhizosphaerae]
MSIALQKAVEHYQRGRPAEALALLLPVFAQSGMIDAQTYVLAGQCCVKTGQEMKAAFYFERAAALGGPSEDMLRNLAIKLLEGTAEVRAEAAALRAAALCYGAEPAAQAHYRRWLRASLLLTEAVMENQRLRDRMLHRADPLSFAVDHPRDHLLWSGDDGLNARQVLVDSDLAPSEPARVARRALCLERTGSVRLAYLLGPLSLAPDLLRSLLPVLQHHDRHRFLLSVICQTKADAEAVRKQGKAACVNVELVSLDGLDDVAAAASLRERAFDVLVDLSGHAAGGRPGILNAGAAAVQALWLGVPGPATGMDVDYRIADPIALPPEAQGAYAEKICLLPEGFMAVEPATVSPGQTRPVLPEGSVLFAAFAAPERITQQTAVLWRSLLQRCAQGFLWLDRASTFAQINFLRFMDAGGVADRVIFGDPQPRLRAARAAAADIGLDTLAASGGEETIDLLMAGVPVVTLKGESFAARCGASLLTAAGLPVEPAESEDGYLTLALDLAEDPERRKALQRAAKGHRQPPPLFNPKRLTAHLELAFEAMARQARAGQAPAPLRIHAL